MSTCSLIGIARKGGLHGVYCHSDGYPEWQLPALRAIVNRLGPLESAHQLMWNGRTGGWRYLDPEGVIHRPGDPGVWVEGIGPAFCDTPAQRPIDQETARASVDFEFSYFIHVGTGDILWRAGAEHALRVDPAPDRHLRWEVAISDRAWPFYVRRGARVVVSKSNGAPIRYKRRETAEAIADELNAVPDCVRVE